MDRPFYASRTTAQFVRSRFRYREDVAYSISSNTRSLKDERTRDHGSSSWKTRMSDKVCTSGGVQDYQVMYNVSLQHIEISGGQSQEGLEHLKLGATLRKWRTRPYNHYLRLSENVSVSEPSSRRRPQLELRHPMKYVPFNQVSITSPIYGFPSSRQCFGRNFTTSPAVSLIEPKFSNTANNLYSPVLIWKTSRLYSIGMTNLQSNHMRRRIKNLGFVRDCAFGRLNIEPNEDRTLTMSHCHQI
jgi:hypothetical protein